jgi:hypothetical protein
MENEKVIKQGKVKITVRRATVLAGTKRYRLMNEGAVAMGVKDLEKLDVPAGVDPDTFSLRVFTYPNFMAATIDIEGLPWPMSFEEFCAVDEELWNDWSRAVREVNSHWYPAIKEANLPKGATPQTESTSA